MGFAVAPLVSIAISIGSQLLLSLFKKSPKQTDPSLQVPKSDYGVGIPKIYGQVRLEGNKFFPQTSNLMYKVVNERSSGSGGKGGGRSSSNSEKKVYGTIALLFCQGETTLEKIIIQGEHIETNHPFFTQYCTWFDGTQTDVWSVVAQDEEPYKFIKYTDVAYLGIHEMPLDRYGNQIPSQVAAILTDAVFGTQPRMDSVVGDILTRAKIDSALWNVTDLNSIVLSDGIIIRQSGESYRETIESLMELYLFAPYQDTNGKIIFRKIKRGDSSAITLNNRYFIPNEDEGSYITEVKSDFELPTKLTLKFYNNSRIYEQDEVNVYLGNKSQSEDNVKTVSETLYTYPYEADARARELLSYFYSLEKNTYKFNLPIYYYSQFNCLDVLTLPNGQTIQVTKISVGLDYTIEVTATYYDSVESSYDAVPDTAITPPVLTDPPIPDLFILDVPVIDNDIPGSLYCFATSGGANIQFSDNNGNSWRYGATHLYPSVIGECTTIKDNTSVTVNIISGNGLESITNDEFAVDMGQNLCLIGKQTAEGYYEGEFLQFQDVALVTANQYTISTFKNGLNGTGTYQHVSGEKFFLFRGEGGYYSIIPGDATFIGKPLLFRAIVSDWQNLATTPTVGVTPVGNAYKPQAPTDATGIIDIEGNTQLFWQYDPLFSPYNDSQETVTYEVDILNNTNTVLRTLSSDVKNVLYLIPERTIDGLIIPIKARIYAVSSVVGRGEPCIANINPILVEDSIFGTGEGLKGIKFIYNNYTVLEEDNRYILIVNIPTAVTYLITFSASLSNGFFCYLISNKINNSASKVTIGCPFTYTGTINNIVLTGNSASVQHISEGKYFVFGNGSRGLQLDEAISISGSNNLVANKLYEMTGPGTLTFPLNPIEGNIIHIVDSPGNFNLNPVILNGNGKNIEGASTFTLEQRDENILFYFNGNQWVYISRFYYIDPAFFLNRANHIGTQLSSTISDFNESVDDRVGTSVTGLLVAGTNITLDYNDPANTLTINSTGGGGGSTGMVSRDVNSTSTLLDTDNKKWIRASGTITLTVPLAPVDYYEAIIQNIGTGVITIAGVANAVGTKITTRWTACHVYYNGGTWTAVGALSV